MRTSKPFYPKNRPQKDTHLKNESIRFPRITLITDTGEKIEDIATADALKMTYDRGFDLVLVNNNPDTPIAKMLDYGKFKYEQTKKLQLQKKQNKVAEIKEIRLRPKTGQHDIDIKVKKIREFIERGHKVKLVMMFRGREAMFVDRGKEAMRGIITSLADVAMIESSLSYQMKRLTVVLQPVKK